jgi:hypothetical protein
MEAAATGRMLATGLVVFGVMSVTAPVGAAEEAGFELGARLGYGVPLGRASGEGDDLNELIAGQVPLWLDLGIRADRLFVGAYFQYGLGLLGDDVSESCEELEDSAEAQPDGDAGCHVRDVRIGAQLHYHFGPPLKPDPWLGIGAGYEWVTVSAWAEADDEEVSLSSTGRGFELLNLQGGIDFPLGPTTSLGPFVTWTLSRFDKASASCNGDCGDLSDEEQDIEDKALHHWVFVGARFSLFP